MKPVWILRLSLNLDFCDVGGGVRTGTTLAWMTWSVTGGTAGCSWLCKMFDSAFQSLLMGLAGSPAQTAQCFLNINYNHNQSLAVCAVLPVPPFQGPSGVDFPPQPTSLENTIQAGARRGSSSPALVHTDLKALCGSGVCQCPISAGWVTPLSSSFTMQHLNSQM